MKNLTFESMYGEKNKFSFDEIYKDCLDKFSIIRKYVKDVSLIIDEYLKQNKSILFEGAQGTLLDIDP